MPLRLLLRGLLVATPLSLSGLGCSDDAFGCLEQDQCGENGQCETNGYCSFPDAACESGRRFADNATDGVANVCVPVSGSTGNLPSTGEGMTDPAPSTSAPSGSSAADSDEDSTSGTSFDDSSFSSGFGSSFGDDTSSSTTAEPVDCIADSSSCLECFDCTHGRGCTELAQGCGVTPGCNQVSACLSGCEATGSCFEDCCEGQSAAAVGIAMALSECHRSACSSAMCPSFPEPMCTVPRPE